MSTVGMAGKYPDRTFWLSPASMKKLYALRDAAGGRKALRSIFRDQAMTLIRDRNPRFEPSGQEPRLQFTAGIGDALMAGLYRVSERFGLPPVAVGEMVLAYIKEPA